MSESTSYESATGLWRHCLGQLLNAKALESRQGRTAEILNWHGTLSDIEDNWVSHGRKASRTYRSAELLWYLSGSPSGELIKAYAPSYTKYLNKGGNADGAYGPRWKDLIPAVIRELQLHPETRRAVLLTWRLHDISYAALGSLDVPCTVALQFLKRDGKLHCTATMRSNDVWLGMPYDIWCFTSLQKLIADVIGAGYGSYHHQVCSMHLYQANLEPAREAIALPWFGSTGSQSTHRSHVFRDYRTWADSALRIEKLARLGGEDKRLEVERRLIHEMPPGHLLTEAAKLCCRKWLKQPNVDQ